MVTTPLTIETNSFVTLDPITYNLDADQPLLVAIDFSATPSAVRSSDHVNGVYHVPPEDALAYYLEPVNGGGNQASVQNRAGNFTDYPGLHLIERIDVG